MTIAVTGGTGFLGAHVVSELLARGHDVRCLIRSPLKGAALRQRLAPELRRRLTVMPGTLERADVCRDLLQHCDTVVHVAAPLTGSVPSLFTSSVIPTRVLAEAAADSGVRRFVLVSSLGVYGSQHLRAGDVLDERCPLDARPHLRDPYTHSKIAQELACWRAHHTRGLPVVVVRPGVLFGPGRPLLTARIGLTVGGVLVQMGGSQRVPYCFVENCAGAVAIAADLPGIAGLSFNVVDDDLPSGNEVLKLHRTHVSSIHTVRIPAFAIRSVARACEWYSVRSERMFPPVLTPYKAAALWKSLRYSNDHAKGRLGWRPLVAFEEGVRRTVDAMRMAPLESVN
jgi:nucleoside-diphosphate-sugar epimerase